MFFVRTMSEASSALAGDGGRTKNGAERKEETEGFQKEKTTTTHLLPVRRVLEPTQVRLQLPSQHLQRRRLPDPVGPDQPQHLPRPRHGQTVQLEGIRSVPVRALALEVLRQVDDHDGVEGALLDADAAADAELLGDPGELGGGRDLDAEFSCGGKGGLETEGR